MQHVFDTFLTPLAAVFGEPVSEDPAKFLSEYARILRPYPTGVLEAARDIVLRTHKGPARWPKIAECVEACEDIVESQSAKTRSLRPGADDWRRRVDNAEHLMITTATGHEAARGGWALGCREFIMLTGRLPHEHEIHTLVRNAIFIDRCASGTVHLGIMHHGLVDLAGKIVARRDAIADRVINGEVRG